MVTKRWCAYRLDDGHPCGAPPQHESPFCLMHDPERANDVQEGRRLGGLRRRREVTVAGAYDVEGLASVDQLRRILHIAVLDTLGLENSIGRARTLIASVLAGARLLETGELEERIATLEAAVLHRQANPASVFDTADGMDALALLDQEEDEG